MPAQAPCTPVRTGKHITRDSFSIGVWKPCMKSLGLPDDLTPHSARHTFGTRMSAAGVRPEDIQRIMGHTDYSMTANVYINQDESTLKEAIAKMA
ncbi:MAG: tyrosine-type recombinase/integrase [Peptoniphilaceae bacterium]|nr:tyrosine-type recombinase/integrase [Peptoniphilaceae bacterium]MDY5766416.1 tyrosine-type recombinase/integrase [Peptoniphilaceae bacterium]